MNILNLFLQLDEPPLLVPNFPKHNLLVLLIHPRRDISNAFHVARLPASHIALAQQPGVLFSQRIGRQAAAIERIIRTDHRMFQKGIRDFGKCGSLGSENLNVMEEQQVFKRRVCGVVRG